jgi:hypothetical protein
LDPLGLAYFAVRKLANGPWIPGWSDNIALRPVMYSHEQLFFEDNGKPSNLGYSDMGVYPEKAPAGYKTIETGFNDCVMRKASTDPSVQWPGSDYLFVTHNCQDWAAAVRSVYYRLEEDPEVKKECCH